MKSDAFPGTRFPEAIICLAMGWSGIAGCDRAQGPYEEPSRIVARTTPDTDRSPPASEDVAPGGSNPPAAPEAKPSGPAPEGMVWIPGGRFWMGGDDPSWADAMPVHQVTVNGFWIDRTEVTNRQFAKFVKATGYVTVAERKPDVKDFPDAPPRSSSRARWSSLRRPVRSRSMIRWSGGGMSPVPTGGIPRAPIRRSRVRTIFRLSRSAGTMPSPMPVGHVNASRPRRNGNTPRGAAKSGRHSSGATN